jgi:hypothetical protein
MSAAPAHLYRKCGAPLASECHQIQLCPIERAQDFETGRITASASFLFDNGPPLRVHKNVVTVAIFTGNQIITVTVALRLDDLVAGLPLQRNGCLKVLTYGRILCNQ